MRQIKIVSKSDGATYFDENGNEISGLRSITYTMYMGRMWGRAVMDFDGNTVECPVRIVSCAANGADCEAVLEVDLSR